MRTRGSADELEYRRRLAIDRLSDGYPSQEAADFLGLDPSTTRRWRIACRERGDAGPVARPVSGRPSTLHRPGEDRPALAHREPSAPRPRDRVVDGGAARASGSARSSASHPIRGTSAHGFATGGLPRRSRNASPASATRRSIAAWLESRLAAHLKKARRQGAHIALIDESGLLMARLARRAWASRGPTPELVQESGAREKVSVAAAVWLSPRRDRLGLYSHTPANGVLRRLAHRGLPEGDAEGAGRSLSSSPGTADRCTEGEPIRDLLSSLRRSAGPWRGCRRRPRCPTPIEWLWSWPRWGRLSNLGPKNALELDGRVVAELAKVRADRAFLRNLFHASDLPLSACITFLTLGNPYS